MQVCASHGLVFNSWCVYKDSEKEERESAKEGKRTINGMILQEGFQSHNNSLAHEISMV